jgi:hypothetical protein
MTIPHVYYVVRDKVIPSRVRRLLKNVRETPSDWIFLRILFYFFRFSFSCITHIFIFSTIDAGGEGEENRKN